MNKHFDNIDILFMSLIISYMVILLLILVVMFIEKNKKPAVVTVEETTGNPKKIKRDNQFFNDLKKHFANLKWNVKNFKYHKLSFIKGIEFKKSGIMDKKVLSLNELIEDKDVLKVANNDTKKESKKTTNKETKNKTSNSKTKRNVPKKKNKSKKKTKKRR